MAKRVKVPKREYTVEEKKGFVKEYLKECHSSGRVDYKALVTWVNEKYGLKDKVNKYDFLEPREMQEWMQMLNIFLMLRAWEEDKKKEK